MRAATSLAALLVASGAYAAEPVWTPPGSIRPVSELPPVVSPPTPEWSSSRPATPPRTRPDAQPSVSFRKPPEDSLPNVDAPPIPGAIQAENPKAKSDDGINDADYPYVGVPERKIIFKIESTEQLENRIVRELALAQRQPGKPVPDPKGFAFPKLPVLTPPGVVYKPKTDEYPAMAKLIEPNYVVHRRLYFEEVNSERYGWDAGVIQPVISTMHFYRDVLLWPSRVGSNFCERYDSSAGKCLPGSPVPYFLYPPEVDLWGGTLGAGVFVGVAAILP